MLKRIINSIFINRNYNEFPKISKKKENSRNKRISLISFKCSRRAETELNHIGGSRQASNLSSKWFYHGHAALYAQ